jgi:TPR repeat protein
VLHEGRAFHFGSGVKTDHHSAIEWYERSIKNGHSDSMGALADFYSLGAHEYRLVDESNPIAAPHLSQMYRQLALDHGMLHVLV